MNGINSIRLDVNCLRYDSATAKKRIVPVSTVESSTEADKKKTFKTEFYNDLNSRKEQSEQRSQLLLSDSKYYRANLLNEIVNKMSGLEERSSPGQIVEYYA